MARLPQSSQILKAKAAHFSLFARYFRLSGKCEYFKEQSGKGAVASWVSVQAYLGTIPGFNEAQFIHAFCRT